MPMTAWRSSGNGKLAPPRPVDHRPGHAYRAGMDANDTFAQLQQLAARVDKLLELTRRLADENRSLRQGQEQLSNERAQLLNKNELARTRVEAMIQRLKSLESNA
jgi:cell division protein ZapB